VRLELSDEQRALQAEADRFCASAAPLLQADAEHAVQGMPSDGDSAPIFQALGEAGLIGVNWPEALGGRGRTLLETVALEERLGYGWLPLSAYLVSVKTVGNAVIRFGSDELRATLIPQIAGGRLIFCQGFSEPEAGSDLAALRTRAELRDGRFVVNGHKIWTSNAQISDWIYIAVRTSRPGEKRHHGITVLVAPMDTPGITVRTFPTMGGGFLSEVFLENVEIPAGHVVGEVDEGWAVLMGTLGFERITSEKIGILGWLLDGLEAETGHRLDALRGEAAAARLHGYRAAWLLDRGLDASAASSMAKLSIALLARKVGRAAVDLLGPLGLLEPSADAPLAGRAAALLRAGIGSTLAGGSSEIQRTVIARRELAAQ
jgi:alkylation response protein AidB-like acyl-CoA dehydrogenase